MTTINRRGINPKKFNNKINENAKQHFKQKKPFFTRKKKANFTTKGNTEV